MSEKLTKYEEGSLSELWTLSYPMILAFMSGFLMMFFDRLFLANYSMASMNAAATAGMVAVIFLYGPATITSIAEVFVGQFNGAGEYRKTASPVWQMLWFSAALVPFYLALTTWGGPYLLPEYHYVDEGLPYFQWVLYFGAAVPAIAALSSFFVGIGKTRYVMAVTIFGNLANIILDPILIFGYFGLTEPLGARGAAIATGVSQLSQVVIFFALFLTRQYKEKYGTTLCRFDPQLFLRCLKVGVPSSIGHMFEWTAWAITLRMMAFAGEHYLTIATIGQSMYMLVAFGVEGVQKAVTTLTANRIGAKKEAGIWKVWQSGVKLLLLSAIPFGILLIGYPDPIIREFLSTETPPSDVALLFPLLRLTAAGVFAYYIFDGLTWITIGVLTAAEDTWFVMWINAMTAWFFGMAPILFFLVVLNWSPVWYFFFMSFYGASNALIFYSRMKTKPWLPILSKQLSTASS